MSWFESSQRAESDARVRVLFHSHALMDREEFAVLHRPVQVAAWSWCMCTPLWKALVARKVHYHKQTNKKQKTLTTVHKHQAPLGLLCSLPCACALRPHGTSSPHASKPPFFLFFFSPSRPVPRARVREEGFAQQQQGRHTPGAGLFFCLITFLGNLPVSETLEFASAPPGQQTLSSAWWGAMRRSSANPLLLPGPPLPPLATDWPTGPVS